MPFRPSLFHASLGLLLAIGYVPIARANDPGVQPTSSAAENSRPPLHQWSFPASVPIQASRPSGGTGNIGNARPTRNADSLALGSAGNPPRQVKDGNGSGGGSE